MSFLKSNSHLSPSNDDLVKEIFSYIKSESVQLEVLHMENPFYIKYFENPSEAVQLAAIEQDLRVFRFIKNPTLKVVNFYNSKTGARPMGGAPPMAPYLSPEKLAAFEIYRQSLETEKMAKAYLKVVKFGF